MKIVALGSPGVGKGTYAQEIIKKYHIPHISTGDLFRENIKSETALGKIAKSYIEKGQLVPDQITIEMVRGRLAKESCNKGFYLDGFPRTIAQAEALSTFCKLDLVISYTADPEVIIERLGGRRICRKCGAIFHLKNLPPKIQGVCDFCGGELYQRDDDQPKAIQDRLKVYALQTAPLSEYYRKKGLLKEVTVNEDFSTHKKLIMDKIFKAIEGSKN